VTSSAAPVRGARSIRLPPRAVRHLASAAGMLLLMLPAQTFGHASLPAIGAMFAFFVWAAVAAALAGRRARSGLAVHAGSVGDPFAMALLMAVPYAPFLVGGHGHGGGTDVSPAVPSIVSACLVVAGWIVLRRATLRVSALDAGFWICLAMMLWMVVASGHAAT